MANILGNPKWYSYLALNAARQEEDNGGSTKPSRPQRGVISYQLRWGLK